MRPVPCNYYVIQRVAFLAECLCLVSHLQTNLAVGACQPDPRHGAAGVTVDVCQAFLDCPEHSDFSVLWKAAKVLRQVQVDFNIAPLREASHVPSQSRGEACLIEQGRMKQVGNSSRFLVHFLCQYHAVRYSFRCLAQRSISVPTVFKFIISAARLWPTLSCSSRAIRRRSSSWNCIKRPVSCRSSSLVRSTSLVRSFTRSCSCSSARRSCSFSRRRFSAQHGGLKKRDPHENAFRSL